MSVARPILSLTQTCTFGWGCKLDRQPVAIHPCLPCAIARAGSDLCRPIYLSSTRTGGLTRPDVTVRLVRALLGSRAWVFRCVRVCVLNVDALSGSAPRRKTCLLAWAWTRPCTNSTRWVRERTAEAPVPVDRLESERLRAQVPSPLLLCLYIVSHSPVPVSRGCAVASVCRPTKISQPFLPTEPFSFVNTRHARGLSTVVFTFCC